MILKLLAPAEASGRRRLAPSATAYTETLWPSGAGRGTPAPPANQLPQLHPAVLTLVQALPASDDPASKPKFSEADREAWFDYARATFNLIYTSDGGGSI